MNSVKFSIVIPVYNVEKYLAASLDALIGQTYKNLEIVAVNDGYTYNRPRLFLEKNCLYQTNY